MLPVTLTDAELVLRPPTLDDVDDLVAAISDPEIAYWIDTIPVPYGRADGERFVSGVSGPGWESGEAPAWLVTVDDDVLGGCGLTRRRPGVWEVGFWLRPAARGRGLATRSVRLASQFAFDTLGGRRVEWQAAVGNVASRAVALRAGFRLEGTCRHRLTSDGEPRDGWLAGLLPADLAGEQPDSAAITPVELRDGPLLLRPWRTADADAVFRACQDPDIQRWTTVPVPYFQEHAEEFVTDSQVRWAAGEPSFAVVDADDIQLLGSIGVVNTSPDGDAEIGYWVAPWTRRRGVASRATAVISRWLLEVVGRPRVVWHAEVGNLASRRVAEAAGFVVEGTARRAMVQRGERVDAWIGSLLPEDLPAPRGG